MTHINGTFGYDRRFLSQHDDVIVLEGGDPLGSVIVSAAFQGKVFTSTCGGEDGPSFGWINYTAFTEPLNTHMNAYGGENRFWLGPEGGKYSLYFKPGAAMVFDNWHTPAAFDTEPWYVVSKAEGEVHFQKGMELMNYQGAVLTLIADRRIRILDKEDIENMVGIELPAGVRTVGYTTDNVITNTGNFSWTEQTGMPCIWILDMFKPSPSTVMVIPYDERTNLAQGGTDEKVTGNNIVTTDYFGEIPPERIGIEGNCVFFKADGRRRGKLGIHPAYASAFAGSYDAESETLTVTLFDVDPTAKYLNQEWNMTKPVFSGDAVNAYNDGPLEDGSQMGPFYELESVSPAAMLAPRASLSHAHTVLHFLGGDPEPLIKKLFGISLAYLRNKI
jgi:hypothetical protein